MEENIKMDFIEIRAKSVAYIFVPQDGTQWWTILNTVTNLWIP
jgi:hypothetical protein